MDESLFNRIILCLKEIESNPIFKYKEENEYLRIIRYSESILKKYKYFVSNNLYKTLLIWTLFIPLSLIIFLLNITFVLLFPGHYPKISKKSLDCLFISHATKSNPNLKGEDRIYGLLSKANKKYLSATIYLNHFSSLSFRKTKWNQSKTNYLLSKNLPIRDSILVIVLININTILTYFRITFSALFRKNFNLSMQLGYLYNQVSRRTISNHFIGKQISRILNETDVRTIVLTFEGHSYEHVIQTKAELAKFKPRIFAYQHSPISPSQIHNLSFIQNKCNAILFSSKHVQKWFYTLSNKDKSRLVLIGSNKSSGIMQKTFNKKSFLIAPEGNNRLVSEFIDIALILKQKFYKSQIIFRIHPDMYLNLKNMAKLSSIKKESEIHISNASLDKDLMSSEFCIYRGSSVGLESINYGCKPIFYGTQSERNVVDPLTLTNLPLKAKKMLVMKDQKYLFFYKINKKFKYYANLDVEKFITLIKPKD